MLPPSDPNPKAARGSSVHLPTLGTWVTRPVRLAAISANPNQTAHQSSFFHSELTLLVMIHIGCVISLLLDQYILYVSRAPDG